MTRNYFLILGAITLAVVFWNHSYQSNYSLTDKWGSDADSSWFGTDSSIDEMNVDGKYLKATSVVEIQQGISEEVVESLDKESVDLFSPSEGHVVSKAKDFVSCMHKGDCNYGSEDYEGKQTRDEFVRVANELLRSSVKDSRVVDVANSFARFGLQFPDYTIQRTSLMMMDQLPLSEESREAILVGARDTLSAEVAELALAQLKKYQRENAVTAIDEYLAYQIERGPFTIGPVVAQKAVRFLNEDNYDRFASLLERLDKQSEPYRKLKASLRDYYLTHRI